MFSPSSLFCLNKILVFFLSGKGRHRRNTKKDKGQPYVSKSKSPNANKCFVGNNCSATFLLTQWEEKKNFSGHWARRRVKRDAKDVNTSKELLFPVLSLIGVWLRGGIEFYRFQFPHLCEGALHLAPSCVVQKWGDDKTDRQAACLSCTNTR